MIANLIKNRAIGVYDLIEDKDGRLWKLITDTGEQKCYKEYSITSTSILGLFNPKIFHTNKSKVITLDGKEHYFEMD